MLHLYIYSLLAGLITANGVPHFIHGILGEKFQTPFNRKSSAQLNIFWGWLNFVVGGYLLHLAHPRAHELRAFALFSLGVIVMALLNLSLIRDLKKN